MGVPISGSLRYDFWCKNFSTSTGEPQGCQKGGPAWEHVNDMNPTGPAWLAVHGDQDLIVPFRNAAVIKEHADSIHLKNDVITVEGGGHVPISELLNVSNPYLTRFTSFLSHVLSTCDLENNTQTTELI